FRVGPWLDVEGDAMCPVTQAGVAAADENVLGRVGAGACGERVDERRRDAPQCHVRNIRSVVTIMPDVTGLRASVLDAAPGRHVLDPCGNGVAEETVCCELLRRDVRVIDHGLSIGMKRTGRNLSSRK